LVTTQIDAEPFFVLHFSRFFVPLSPTMIRKDAETSNKLNINQWAEEDRPREKMERLGAQALSDAELLAILVGSGSTKEDAVSLMKRILNDCNNNLNTLGKMSIHDLCRYNGVGPAKAITIMAACELGKRRQMETPEERPDLGTATRIYNHMHPVMQDLDTEEFWILLMNQNHRLHLGCDWLFADVLKWCGALRRRRMARRSRHAPIRQHASGRGLRILCSGIVAPTLLLFSHLH